MAGEARAGNADSEAATAPAASASRREVLAQLSELILAVRRPHPVRVAIDGPDTAGKTTLADELAPVIRASGRSAIRASVDDFHRPRSERHRRGADSALGYFEDAFDYHALRSCLLAPLGPGGDLRYRPAVFDFRTDTRLAGPSLVAPVDAVLLVDGVFLLRSDLRDAWDVRIFVWVEFDEILRRAARRDTDLFGSAAAVERRYRTRYLPGQELYLSTERPQLAADVVVDNNDPSRPSLRLTRTP
jgi:uridine kinase